MYSLTTHHSKVIKNNILDILLVTPDRKVVTIECRVQPVDPGAWVEYPDGGGALYLVHITRLVSTVHSTKPHSGGPGWK